ncbi:MAG: prepilin peptidase, partial [Candidatus Marinimicrobia bacterium]|nr:prepilin peptidase [Candidatus Neomarinimicrobiota bacterium]
WLLLRGKCRNCKERISIRYPMVELSSALWFVWMYLQFGLSWEFAQYLTLGIILLAISMVDLDTKLIPDSVLLVGGVSALVFAIMGNVISLKGSLMGGAVMGGVLFAIALIGGFVLKKESMGFGDVKLSVMIGLFIGWEMALLAIFLSAIFASVISIGGLLMGRMKFGKPFAFGPFLALGAIVSGIWGEGIMLAYLKWALG